MSKSTSRHDDFLTDSHSKRFRVITADSSTKSCREPERIESQKRKEKAFCELMKEARERRRENARQRMKQDTIEGIDNAEANLRRLGLDPKSTKQECNATPWSLGDCIKHQNNTSKINETNSNEVAEKGIVSGSIYAGITSLLRRVNEELDTDEVNLYELTRPPDRQRQNLQPSKPLCPTANKRDVYSDNTDSDIESEEIDLPSITLSSNEEYVAIIRKRKLADRIALKERDVRRYKLNAEQTQSKNEVHEKKELLELLTSAKSLNISNRQKAIDKYIQRALEGHEREKKEQAMQLQRADRLKATSVALQKVAEEAEQKLKKNHEVFLRDHEQWQEAKNLKKQKNNEEIHDYCHFLSKTIVDLVEIVIEKSTTKLSDGSTRYKRVQFGVSEWRDVISQAFKDKTSVIKEECEIETPGIAAAPVRQKITQSVKLCDEQFSAAVNQLVKYDIIYHRMGHYNASEKDENRNESTGTSVYRCIYVSGDTEISGVTLLSQCPDNLVNLCNPKAYLVISPRLIYHLFFQRAIMEMDIDIASVEEEIASKKAELISKQAMVMTPQGKNVKGKESRKDQNPNVMIVTQLNNQISDLNKKLATLHTQKVQFETESEKDAKHLDKDSLLQLLGQVAELMYNQYDDGQPVNNEQELVPLTLSLMASHPALAQTTYIFAGFEEMGIEPSHFKGLFEFWSFAHCMLDCTTITRLERLSTRSLYRKTFPPLSAILAPEESKKKKKTKSQETILIEKDLQPPQDIVVHPLLSPLEEISSKPVADKKASSPFLEYSDRSTNNTIFIRSLSWEGNFGDDPYENLYQYVHAKDSQQRAECSFKCEIDDSAINLCNSFSLPSLVPGCEATNNFHESDNLHFVKAKLCAEIIKTCSTLNVQERVGQEATDVDALESVVRNIRDKQSHALLTITNLVNLAVVHFSDTKVCYPEDQFIVPPTDLTTDTPDGLKFARWKQANAQMCRDQRLLVSLCDQTQAEMDQALCDCRSTSEKAGASFSDTFGQIMLVETYIVEIFEMVKLAINEWILHLFKLHCESKTDDDQNTFFSACSLYRPKNPHELISIIDITSSGFSTRSKINLFPEEQSSVLSAVQVKSLLWVFRGLPRTLEKTQFEYCLAIIEFIGVHLPSFCPSGLRCDWIEGPVSLNWALTAMSIGRLHLNHPTIIPYPDVLQAKELLSGLLSLPECTPSLEQWRNLEWWFDNRTAKDALWMIFCAPDVPFNPVNLLHFLLGSKIPTNCLLLLKQWFSHIELIEKSYGTQPTSATEFTLTPKQLEAYFPIGTFKEIDGQLLAYFSGQRQQSLDSVSFHMISTSNYGKAMIKQMDLSFPHFVSNQQ